MTALALPAFNEQEMANMARQQKAAMSRQDIVRFKQAGNVRFRLLPSGGADLAPGARPKMSRKFGTHVIPRTDGQSGYHRIICDYHTNDRPCPVDAKIAEYRKWKKQQTDAGKPVDPTIDKLIDGSGAGERYLVNMMLSEAPGVSCDPNKVVTVDLTKTQYEVIVTIWQRAPMLFHPTAGNWVQAQLAPRPAGGGMTIIPFTVEAPSAVTVDIEAIPCLDDVLAREHRNAVPASSFTGDFYSPVSSNPALAAPTPMPALQAPVANWNMPAPTQGVINVANAAAAGAVNQVVAAPQPPVLQAVPEPVEDEEEQKLRQLADALGMDIDVLRAAKSAQQPQSAPQPQPQSPQPSMALNLPSGAAPPVPMAPPAATPIPTSTLNAESRDRLLAQLQALADNGGGA